jgi:dTDP-4-dehydrorhamnose reductase
VRVFITGAGGQLGRELVAAFADHRVVSAELPGLDVTDRGQVLEAMDRVRPDAVVHAAAWTDVDGCESDPDRAFAVNTLGTRNVAAAARLVAARVCYVSTDYVFDGTLGRPYNEWDRPNPLSVYGRSKLGGEHELAPDDVIVRTSWLCGRHGRNFVRTVIDRARAGAELSVVDDQHGCFTLASDLAGMMRHLVVGRRSGIYHVTNQGATSWYGLACEALAAAGLDPAGVRAVSTAELSPPRPARRPAFAVLDNAALRLSGEPLMPHRHDALRRLVAEITAGGAGTSAADGGGSRSSTAVVASPAGATGPVAQ